MTVSFIKKLFAATTCMCLLAPGSVLANLQEENPGGRSASSKQPEPRLTRGQSIRYDTEDPLFLAQQADFLFKTEVSFGNSILRASETLVVGVNNGLNLLADIKYQQNFDGPEDGFSGFGLTAMYRFNSGPFISDIFAGIEFAGNSNVPEFANNIWSGGARIGRQWSAVTLAATGKTSWIFDEVQGQAWIDFSPEIYFRIRSTVTLGAYSDLRKSTDPNFDRQWVGGKLGIRFGRTFYTGFADYEFEREEWRGGFRLNLLF